MIHQCEAVESDLISGSAVTQPAGGSSATENATTGLPSVSCRDHDHDLESAASTTGASAALCCSMISVWSQPSS